MAHFSQDGASCRISTVPFGLFCLEDAGIPDKIVELIMRQTLRRARLTHSIEDPQNRAKTHLEKITGNFLVPHEGRRAKDVGSTDKWWRELEVAQQIVDS